LQNDQLQILSFIPTLVISTHPCHFDRREKSHRFEKFAGTGKGIDCGQEKKCPRQLQAAGAGNFDSRSSSKKEVVAKVGRNGLRRFLLLLFSMPYSTVTLLARLRGWSTSQPRRVAIS
jgi:hypothetical protein